MTFSQLHERLRLEIKRRVERGLLTGSFLAAQADLKPSHISNFLARKRNHSQAALDRVLVALSLTVADLVPAATASPARRTAALVRSLDRIPLVAAVSAISSPIINRSAILEVIRTPAGMLDGTNPGPLRTRREWHRFVAVRVSAEQALPMMPILRPQSVLILDRHYLSLKPLRPPQPNLYAVNYASTLTFRYVSLQGRQLILRPYAFDHPIELLEIGSEGIPSDLIVGRVCLCIAQL